MCCAMILTFRIRIAPLQVADNTGADMGKIAISGAGRHSLSGIEAPLLRGTLERLGVALCCHSCSYVNYIEIGDVFEVNLPTKVDPYWRDATAARQCTSLEGDER